ncbi:hypothetical protein LZ554_008671 [Drepanopeziza brunnea f. sp. 'monogermtubi']|nr:hypothetical protein LZ554_008671 [Drepanopeziza brunnea f. sp. 'monogermtubi']
MLAAAAPKCSQPILTQNATATSLSIDEYEVAEFINMKTDDVECMRRYHSLFVDLVNFGPPKLDYKRGTDGIVMAVEESSFPILLVNLLMLRRTNSTLPVEVFLATPKDYEEQICEVILPELNARCIVLSSLLENSKVDPKGTLTIAEYPLKLMAVLLSSFESVLLLEADTFLLQQPDALFSSEPFISSHLVFWPDLAAPTFASQLSSIIGLINDVLFESPTIAGGQILISKRHHAATLLLTAYYNIHGQFYSPLLTQGRTIGNDDFLAAALALNATSYTLYEPPRLLGPKSNSTARATLQHDPTTDFNCEALNTSSCTATPFFLNSNWAFDTTTDPFVKQPWGRMWGSKAEGQILGVDIEAVVWGAVVEVACEQRLVLRGWRNEGMPVCGRAQGAYRVVFGREYDRFEG